MNLDLMVAVPVRNEASRLPRLLNALARQRGAGTFGLILFFDGCDDGGPTLAANMSPALPYPVACHAGKATGAANAGLARARACTLALDAAPSAALLTTDADTVPADDWIAACRVALAAADVVAGRVDTPKVPSTLRQQHLAAYFDRLHRHRRRLDPVPWEDGSTHHWTSGANLAFAPDVYRSLGGFAAIPHGEDADLADRAWRAGLRLRRDARVRVTTSPRRDGRAGRGFAGLLATLDRADAELRVAHPDDEAWRYRHHAEARRCWHAGVSPAFADAVGHDRPHAAAIAAAAANAEAFTAHAVGSPPGGMRYVTLARAGDALAALEDAMVETA